MATTSQTATTLSRQEPATLRWGVWLMSAAGVAFIGYGIIFFIRNFTGDFLELGIGEGQVASSKDEIKAFDNDLFHYISHLHIAIAGFIAAVGLAVVFLSWFGVRRGYMWAWVGAVATPVLALLVALPAHYPWGFATIGHLGLIYLATGIFVVGALLALRALSGQDRSAL
jgi:phosphoglycerol transferase MdoB-like AlkP superfamily enzyme